MKFKKITHVEALEYVLRGAIIRVKNICYRFCLEQYIVYIVDPETSIPIDELEGDIETLIYMLREEPAELVIFEAVSVNDCGVVRLKVGNRYFDHEIVSLIENTRYNIFRDNWDHAVILEVLN